MVKVKSLLLLLSNSGLSDQRNYAITHSVLDLESIYFLKQAPLERAHQKGKVANHKHTVYYLGQTFFICWITLHELNIFQIGHQKKMK